MAERDDDDDGYAAEVATVQAMTEEELEAIPEAPSELAELMGRVLNALTRHVPLGMPCPECGSLETVHSSFGNPEGEERVESGLTVVLPPGVFLAYCECDACEHTWDSDKA